jgi:hypothetical protein
MSCRKSQSGSVRHLRIQNPHGSVLKYFNLENVPRSRVTSMTLCVIILMETLFLLTTLDDGDQEMMSKMFLFATLDKFMQEK